MTKQLVKDEFKPYGSPNFEVSFNDGFYGKQELGVDWNGNYFFTGAYAAGDVDALLTELASVADAVTTATDAGKHPADAINVKMDPSTQFVYGQETKVFSQAFIDAASPGLTIKNSYDMIISLPDSVTQIMTKYNCVSRVGYIYKHYHKDNRMGELRLQGGLTASKRYIGCNICQWDDVNSRAYNTYDAYYHTTQLSGADEYEGILFAVYCKVVAEDGSTKIVTSEWISESQLDTATKYAIAIDRTVVSLETVLERVNALQALIEGVPNSVSDSINDMQSLLTGRIEDVLTDIRLSNNLLAKSVDEVGKLINAQDDIMIATAGEKAQLLLNRMEGITVDLNVIKKDISDMSSNNDKNTILSKVISFINVAGAIAAIIGLAKNKNSR